MTRARKVDGEVCPGSYATPPGGLMSFLIDPENREQAEELAAELAQHGQADWRDQVQDALRAMATRRQDHAAPREHIISDTEECWCQPVHVVVDGKSEMSPDYLDALSREPRRFA